MTTFNPLVSIVIPVYNGSNYLREAIDSALAQTYKNIEIIVVNDGSTDNTEEIAKSYGNKIRYFKKENGGVSTALNFAIRKAKGEFISWLSHDDMYYPDKIEVQIKYISENKNCSIVYGNVEFVDDKSKVISKTMHEKNHDFNNLINGVYPVVFGLVNGCVLLVKKTCYVDMGFFDENLKTSNDYDMWYKIFKKYNIGFISNILIKYRLHKEQGTKVSSIFIAESDELWLKIIADLKIETISKFNININTFYKKIAKNMENASYLNAFKYVNSRMDCLYKKPPTLSIIMPCFNSELYLKEAILSILNQKYTNFELIIIDDFSQDKSWDIIRFFEKKDLRIIAFKNANRLGISRNMNIGLSIAKGRYITRMDSDDISLPDRLKKQIDFLENNREFSICSVNISGINHRGVTIHNELFTKKNAPIEWLFLWQNPIANAPAMYRSSIIKEGNIFFNPDFKVAEDYDFLSRLAINNRLYQIDDVLYKYRIHDESIFSKNMELSCKNSYKICSQYAYSLTNFISPKFHKMLTVFCKKDTKLNKINKSELYKWMEMLLKSCKNKWNWNFEEYVSAIHDAEDRIKPFLKEFDKDYNSLFKRLSIIKNIHIGDNDLIGNKFNGHDLHIHLRNKNIDSTHLVWNKESNDKNTYILGGEKINRKLLMQDVIKTQELYCLNSILNPFVYDIIYNKLFLDSNVVHLHLIHNYIFDIQLLPIICQLKPVVWSLHDPWSLGGHCIHHYGCKRWMSFCSNCPHLNTPFPLLKDNSALNFEIKKTAIQNSNFEIIVASPWLKNKICKSPLFLNKKIHLIPYGINQKIFKPILDRNKIKKDLKIPTDAFIITFRCDYSGFKGMDYIEYLLKNLKVNKKIFLLILANKFRGKLNYQYKEFGWVKDDVLLSKIYNVSDLFLAPSKGEAFGMMAAEAMSCKVLPIVLDGTALKYTVNSPACGISTKRQKDLYCETVKYFIENDNERLIRAEKCFYFAVKNYDIDKNLKRILEVYKSVIKNHRLSESSSILLHQLKKNMSIQPTEKNIFYDAGDSFLKSKFTYFLKKRIKEVLVIWFYKLDKIFPKTIRKKVKYLLIRCKLI